MPLVTTFCFQIGAFPPYLFHIFSFKILIALVIPTAVLEKSVLLLSWLTGLDQEWGA
jgi:hypothetical protein